MTQILDRPLHGRILFEEIIRENLDIGRPDTVQLIFQRRVSKLTPGRFLTRVLTKGVIPSLRLQELPHQANFKPVADVPEVAARTETMLNNFA